LDKPSAVMFFDVDAALAALPWLGERTRAALSRLLPGGVTVLVPNPGGEFPLACGADGSVLGVRVPDLPALASVGVPVLQSSANLAGGPDPTRLDEVPAAVRAGADLVLDGGPLPGTPSTVVDLRDFEDDRDWSIVRSGAMPAAEVGAALEWQFHFDPDTYIEMIRGDIPDYDEFQAALVGASGDGSARRILDLGTGTGETARRLLDRHSGASLVGVDVSESMLSVARGGLPAERVSLVVARLEDPLPPGPFDLVASALCVHHLAGTGKADLFARIVAVLEPGGRFVLGDVVVPADPAAATTSLTPGYDFPSPVEDQLAWLASAGFRAEVVWARGDLAVIVARA
jgi:tRNA A37 threonylcarbamoyladenosine synthetase subunit TsaC/SUA5/YrdC/SAM-dependent methyltransferase